MWGMGSVQLDGSSHVAVTIEGSIVVLIFMFPEYPTGGYLVLSDFMNYAYAVAMDHTRKLYMAHSLTV